MKKIVGAFLTLFMAVSPLGLCVAEQAIYWGQEPATNFDITDKDFSINFGKSQPFRTFGDQEIYDTYKSRDVIPETQQSNTNRAIRSYTPVQPEPIVRQVPPARTNVNSPLPSQRSNTGVTTKKRVVPSIAPKPAETLPGEQPPASANTSVNSKVEPEIASPDDQDRPAKKKMKWGQTESKASESENKFRWGQQDQSN